MYSGQHVREVHLQSVFMLFFSFTLKKLLETLSSTCFFLPIATQGGLSFPLPLFLGFLGCEQSRYIKYILEF